VPVHTRRKTRSDFADEGRNAPFFDEAVVPVQTIEVPSPAAQGLAPEQYEVIGQKVSHRLAQRPGSFVVLKYVRPVTNRLDTRTLRCAQAAVGVIEGSRADVNLRRRTAGRQVPPPPAAVSPAPESCLTAPKARPERTRRRNSS